MLIEGFPVWNMFAPVGGAMFVLAISTFAICVPKIAETGKSRLQFSAACILATLYVWAAFSAQVGGDSVGFVRLGETGIAQFLLWGPLLFAGLLIWGLWDLAHPADKDDQD